MEEKETLTSTIIQCPYCGAPADGPLCEYCGAQVAPDLDFEQQKQALESYHHVLATGDESRRVKLLEHGFLPDDKRILIEAGLRCLSLIGDNGERKVRLATVGRLKAVTSQLRVMPTDVDVFGALAVGCGAQKTRKKRKFQFAVWAWYCSSGNPDTRVHYFRISSCNFLSTQALDVDASRSGDF